MLFFDALFKMFLMLFFKCLLLLCSNYFWHCFLSGCLKLCLTCFWCYFFKCIKLLCSNYFWPFQLQLCLHLFCTWTKKNNCTFVGLVLPTVYCYQEWVTLHCLYNCALFWGQMPLHHVQCITCFDWQINDICWQFICEMVESRWQCPCIIESSIVLCLQWVCV